MELSLYSVLMMVNGMCQLDGVVECPGIRLNSILGVHVRVFLNEINIGIKRN